MVEMILSVTALIAITSIICLTIVALELIKEKNCRTKRLTDTAKYDSLSLEELIDSKLDLFAAEFNLDSRDIEEELIDEIEEVLEHDTIEEQTDELNIERLQIVEEEPIVEVVEEELPIVKSDSNIIEEKIEIEHAAPLSEEVKAAPLAEEEIEHTAPLAEEIKAAPLSEFNGRNVAVVDGGELIAENNRGRNER